MLTSCVDLSIPITGEIREFAIITVEVPRPINSLYFELNLKVEEVEAMGWYWRTGWKMARDIFLCFGRIWRSA